MLAGVPPSSRGTVRQGGKEELRASILKTYLLRVRAERGERAVRQLLAGAGIDPAAVDNETGWLSQLAVRRALHAIAELLGRDAVRHRGDWVVHPEALGVLVRMLRVSTTPVDAFRYLAQNAREVTRVGTWDFEQMSSGKSLATRRGESLRMTYRPFFNDEETTERADAA